jgi:hypothetical protein
LRGIKEEKGWGGGEERGWEKEVCSSNWDQRATIYYYTEQIMTKTYS